MRVAAGTNHVAVNRNAKVTQNRRTAAFRLALRGKLPEKQWMEEWGQFRRLARALFGGKAFLPKQKGEAFRRLNLTASQLRFIADHPGRVAKAIKALQDAGQFDAQDDFTDRKTNVPDVKATVKLVQEAKYTNLRKEVDRGEWGVHQHRTDLARKGSAVVWNRNRVRSLDRGFALGVKPQGRKMLTRWITWSDVVIDGVKVRMASAHRPPKRFKALWPDFDRNLARFVKQTKLPLIIGMDSNTKDPRSLERATGLRWEGLRGDIDGFLVSKGIKVDKLREGPKRASDHNPIIARFTVTQRHGVARP